MKTKFFLTTALAVAMLAASCSKSEDAPDPSDPNVQVPDPAGTVTLSMRNENSGNTYLDNTDIHIDKADNFSGARFVSLGRMNGLGNVTYIPKTGWTTTVAVVPGEGYLAYANNRFYRLYVTKYTSNVMDEIIGAEVKYQAPFGGSGHALKVPTEPVVFAGDEDEADAMREIVFDSGNEIIPFTVETDLRYDIIYSDNLSFLPEGIRIYSPGVNYEDENRSYPVRILYEGGEAEIPVTVEGLGYYFRMEDHSFTFDHNAGLRTIPFESNMPDLYFVNSELSDWCRVIYEGGNELTLDIDKNESGEDRRCVINVYSGKRIIAEFAVTQTATVFKLSSYVLQFDRESATRSVTVLPIDLAYTVRSRDSWCACSVFSNVVTIVPDKNRTGSDRETIVYIAADGQEEQIRIEQSRYAPGDYYDNDGVRGIIFQVDGFHGKILSLDETQAQWSTVTNGTGASDEYDGMENMKTIRAIANWNTFYPAFAWCEAKNANGATGWYLPAIHEFDVIGSGSIEGEDGGIKNCVPLETLNTALPSHGGTPIELEKYYWTSTEPVYGYYYDDAYSIAFNNEGGPNGSRLHKTGTYRLRAVRKF